MGLVHQRALAPVAMDQGIILLGEVLIESGGPLGRVLRRGSVGPLRPRGPGVSLDTILPSPLLRVQDMKYVKVGAGRSSTATMVLANLMLASINLLYAGREAAAVCCLLPTPGLHHKISVFSDPDSGKS